MSGIFGSAPAWLTTLVLAIAMCVAWRFGIWRGRRLAENGAAASPGKLEDAGLALLGLLLAFTFSLALAKNDRRREALVADSNAIGDFYTCASLLPDPVKQDLQTVVRRYTAERIEITRRPYEALTASATRAFVDEHSRMTELVSRAIREGTPIAVPLTNTLNGLTSSHADRLAAVRDRLPWSVVGLLFLAAVFITYVSGRQQGETHSGGRGTIPFILLVCLVVNLTLDLNQPNRGLIRLSQEPLEQLLSSMGPEQPAR